MVDNNHSDHPKASMFLCPTLRHKGKTEVSRAQRLLKGTELGTKLS